ncbi:transposase [Paenibacillus allorhizosphaerae]|uniref:Transposase zinc-ribbon domain-containing protein n=1 Tax=Paenibacillus allorhizosphaerae TaxID=2849866 RepID=A0ABM8VCL5_9BACL|nr:hypothetical protein PAECIP111802_01058 [Paenibacillus allorhizosphaerae]
MNGELTAIDTSFQEQFGTEEACAQYLFQVKWPDGYSCPRCSVRNFTSGLLPFTLFHG